MMKQGMGPRKAVNLNPPVAQTHKNLAISYENLREYEKARQYYQKALDVDPGYERRNNLEEYHNKAPGKSGSLIYFYSRVIIYVSGLYFFLFLLSR